jgi:hypothetical protein
MHGCVKRRFATHQNASKILLGGKFKIMLKTSQICCLWPDSNNWIKNVAFTVVLTEELLQICSNKRTVRLNNAHCNVNMLRYVGL